MRMENQQGNQVALGGSISRGSRLLLLQKIKCFPLNVHMCQVFIADSKDEQKEKQNLPFFSSPLGHRSTYSLSVFFIQWSKRSPADSPVCNGKQ